MNEDREQRRIAKEVMERQHAAIRHLLASEGWALFEHAFKGSRDLSYKLMVSAENAHTAAVQLGAYHVTRSALTWPEMQLKLLERQLEQIQQLDGG